jgi:hypothetical protein
MVLGILTTDQRIGAGAHHMARYPNHLDRQLHHLPEPEGYPETKP